MGLSLMCLTAIVLVAQLYDGKTSPKLPYGITLNAIVSILAALSKSSLIFAVAGTLGQLKWCWFKRSRKLQDLQLFDDASRGPIGSLAMLFSFTWRPLASVAALVTILALVFDPFVQQILKYPTRQLHNQNPAIITPRASTFVINSHSVRLSTTVNAGMWSEIGQFDRNPPCPSGTCNWPTFKSTAWCTKCTDLSSTAVAGSCDIPSFWRGETTEQNCNMTLGWGRDASIVHCAKNQDVSTTEFEKQPDFNGHCDLKNDITWALHQISDYGTTPEEVNSPYLDIDTPLMVLGHASLNDTANVPHIERAEACVLTPCEKDILVSTEDGIASTETVSTNYGIIIVYALPDEGPWQRSPF